MAFSSSTVVLSSVERIPALVGYSTSAAVFVDPFRPSFSSRLNTSSFSPPLPPLPCSLRARHCSNPLFLSRSAFLNARPLPFPVAAAATAAAGGVPLDPNDASSGQFPALDGEADTWPPPGQSSFLPRLRAILFYLFTLLLALPLIVSMLLMHPFVLLFDGVSRRAHHWVNDIWAQCSTAPFYSITIQGEENLPPPSSPAVYVANHSSFLDIYSLFSLRRPFKFISKTSNFLIPVIGWAMYLTGHIPLKRMDKRSQMDCLKLCLSFLTKGAPVLFFPEGTRAKDGKMAGFKKGAFTIAAKAGVPVVPISLIGTGQLMPSGMENTLSRRKGGVTIIVHPPITGKDADQLCKEAREVIAASLLENGQGVHPQGDA